MAQEFPLGGSFYRRKIHGHDYWYFKSPVGADGARHDKYVGPDSEELRAKIAAHGQAKSDYKDRRSMVVALQRAGLSTPSPITGKVLQALAGAGVFRLRAVVVGSIAYQAYSGLLGCVLSAKNAATSDLDVAQFLSISMEVKDAVEFPFETILKNVDPNFRAIPTLHGRHATRYALGDSQYRVDILTPNRGPDTDEPVVLPALRADAQPLRYLDFLIYNEVQAVALYGDGVLINVPSPERYALHKLLVSRLRLETSESQAKADKDLRQAGELLEILVDRRPFEIRDLWSELTDRGPKWRQHATEAASLLSPTLARRLDELVNPTIDLDGPLPPNRPQGATVPEEGPSDRPVRRRNNKPGR
jgi:hypothetical protein